MLSLASLTGTPKTGIPGAMNFHVEAARIADARELRDAKDFLLRVERGPTNQIASARRIRDSRKKNVAVVTHQAEANVEPAAPGRVFPKGMEYGGNFRISFIDMGLLATHPTPGRGRLAPRCVADRLCSSLS